MAYGIQIYLGNQEVDVVNSLAASYVLAYPVGTSGSLTLTVPDGYTVKYYIAGNDRYTQSQVTINGSNVTWSGIKGRIIFYCEVQ